MSCMCEPGTEESHLHDDGTQGAAGVRRARRTERTTGARDCKTPVPSVQMSNVQRTMVCDVVVWAPDNPSEFWHLHAFSLSHPSLRKPLVVQQASHLCRVCAHVLTQLVAEDSTGKVIAERAH